MNLLFDRVRDALADRYVVERELGSGGAAVVFLATDRHNPRQVAIKVLRPDVAERLGADRFRREIQIASTLVHPHVLPLHDSGDIGGLLYYAMPYVEGDSLRDRLCALGTLPIGDAVRIARELSAALDYAHQRGIVHRDVKPGNVFLAGSHAVLGDFGIATALAAAPDDLTTSGTSLGTVAYMSPEQIDGVDVDHRTDIYALGCVLYEMLTGTPPFGRGRTAAVLAGHASRDPEPIGGLRPDVPDDLAALVSSCLSKDPAGRPASAAELEAALEALSAPDSHSWTRPRPRRTALAPGLVGGALLLLALIGAALALRQGLRPSASGAEGPYAVLPIRNAQWSVEQRTSAWELARDVTSALARWEGVQAVPQVAMAGPIFDLGFDDGTPGTVEEARALGRALGSGPLLLLDVRFRADSIEVERFQVDPSTGRILGDGSARLVSAIGETAFLVRDVVLELIGLADESSTVGDPFRLSEVPAAIEAFSTGRRHLDRWELGPSRAALQEAVALDSTFAMAHYHLAVATYWLGVGGSESLQALGPEIQRSITQARLHASSLPSSEVRQIEAFEAFVQSDFRRARAEYQALLAATPNDPYLHLLLGSVEFRDRTFDASGPIADWNRAITSFEESVRLSPDFSLGYGHLFDLWRDLSDPTRCLVFRPEESPQVLLWEQPNFDDIRPFCPVLRDSIGWADVSQTATPDQGDGRLLSSIEARTARQLQRWAAYARDQPRPLEELTRWTLLVRQRLPAGGTTQSAEDLGATALEYFRQALELRTDTTALDRSTLAVLHLAAGDPDDAVRQAESSRLREASDEVPRPFSAHPFMASGRAEAALAEVLPAYGSGRIAARTRSGDFVPFGVGEVTAIRLQLVGGLGLNDQRVREDLGHLLSVWSPEAVGAEGSLALRGAVLGRIGPALASNPDLVGPWFEGLTDDDIPDLSLAPFWRGWRALPDNAEDATAALGEGAVLAAGPTGSATALYLYARLAQRIGDHEQAIRLLDQLRGMPQPVLGAFHVGWGLRNLALLRRSESLVALGRVSEATEALSILDRAWSRADPAVRALLETGRRP